MAKKTKVSEAVQEPINMTVHSGKAASQSESDNVVMLIGKITKVVTEKSVTILKLRIPRRGRGGKAQFTTPKVYFFHDDKTGVEEYMEGDNVKIIGHLTNPMKRRPNGTMFFSQAVVGDRIEKNSSLFKTELDVPADSGLVSTQPVSLVYLRGNVEAISAAGNHALNIRMNARQNGRNNHVNVLTYQKDSFKINPGDVITVYGRLETRTTERGGQYRFYQNAVAQRIDNHSQEK